MKHHLFLFCTVIFLAMGYAGLQAQEALTAACGNASAEGQGLLSYTVGQVFYTINTGAKGTVAQGVQQPYEISSETGTSDVYGITLSASAYPNPVNDYLIFEASGVDIKELKLLLLDNKGTLLKTIIPADYKTTIPVYDLKPATYYLMVTGNHKEIKVFKIIKTGSTE